MHIDISKAAGPDVLSNCILRDFAPLLSQPICAVFNACLREGFFPECWKSAEVIPAPKVNPPRSFQDDLRPISLIPTLGKILESIIGGWMLEILQPSFDKYQFGAIKGRSTAHALISLLHEWMETLDAGGSVRTMFVDFRKGFDHVDHNLLISKLLSYDIPHCIIRWVHSYLSHRRQRVCVNGELSAWTRLIGDMPQGSWLGPLYIFGSN